MSLLAYRACDQVIPASAHSSQYQRIAKKKVTAERVPANVVPIWYDIVFLRRRLLDRHCNVKQSGKAYLALTSSLETLC
jgi:hypothetical protein